MSRTIHADTLAALSDPTVRFMYMVEIQMDSGTIAFNGALKNYVVDSKTFVGLGNLGRVGAVQESTQLDPASISISLSGVNQTLVAAILGENYLNRRGLVYIAILDESDNIIGDPILHFDGLIASLDITYGRTSSISLTLNDRLVLWNRPKVRRYTKQDQQVSYPSDKGFDFVESIANKEVIWPAAKWFEVNK